MMKLKQGGFGLMEVMVSVGLTGVLSYIVMQQSDMSSKQQAKANYNQALNTLTTSIQAELSKSENCSASLRNLAYGTMASPTVVTIIRKGIVNTVTTPPTITNGPTLFETRKSGSIGIYIDQMGLMKRPLDNKKVLRVHFKPGDISGTGVIKNKAQLGGKSISKDFLISATDNVAGTVILSCQSESTNLLSSACASLPGGVWNNLTKKCEVSGVVTDTDLRPLWSTASGGISPNKPADVPNGEVTCQKSSKRCSRTNANCNLPACPANHYPGTAWEWDRKQSTWDYACMKSAKCVFRSTQAGWMVKP
jgi:type II secretory pathway pseudopilin PulG